MKRTAFVPTRAPGRGRIEFGHFALITANLDAMVAWYRTVFDMEVVFIALPGRGAAPEPAPQRVDHIAFRCTDHDHLVRWYRTLGRAAIEPLRATNHGIITSIYYADPDGNQIEFYADNFPTIEDRSRDRFRGHGDAAAGWRVRGAAVCSAPRMTLIATTRNGP
jgi:catechol-2,3-dioxygenase